jgi:hypothetical protein
VKWISIIWRVVSESTVFFLGHLENIRDHGVLIPEGFDTQVVRKDATGTPLPP